MRAVYDTIVRPVRLVLVDTTGREFPIGGVTAPVHRIYWLDNSQFDRAQRTALIKAFDEAALYDDAARTASVAAGTRVFAAEGVGPWGTFVDDEPVHIYHRAGGTWVSVTQVDGLEGLNHCKPAPTEAAAWVPQGSVTRTGPRPRERYNRMAP